MVPPLRLRLSQACPFVARTVRVLDERDIVSGIGHDTIPLLGAGLGQPHCSLSGKRHCSGRAVNHKTRGIKLALALGVKRHDNALRFNMPDIGIVTVD